MWNIISEIIPNRLYLSGLKGATSIDNVLNLNIDIIVSILDYDPFKYNPIRQYGNIQLVYFKASDSDDFDISKYFTSFCDIMDDNPNSKILVHCLVGASRSASLVISYRINQIVKNKTIDIIKKHNVEMIIRNIRKKRDCVSPNDG